MKKENYNHLSIIYLCTYYMSIYYIKATRLFIYVNMNIYIRIVSVQSTCNGTRPDERVKCLSNLHLFQRVLSTCIYNVYINPVHDRYHTPPTVSA